MLKKSSIRSSLAPSEALQSLRNSVTCTAMAKKSLGVWMPTSFSKQSHAWHHAICFSTLTWWTKVVPHLQLWLPSWGKAQHQLLLEKLQQPMKGMALDSLNLLGLAWACCPALQPGLLQKLGKVCPWVSAGKPGGLIAVPFALFQYCWGGVFQLTLLGRFPSFTQCKVLCTCL